MCIFSVFSTEVFANLPLDKTLWPGPINYFFIAELFKTCLRFVAEYVEHIIRSFGYSWLVGWLKDDFQWNQVRNRFCHLSVKFRFLLGSDLKNGGNNLCLSCVKFSGGNLLKKSCRAIMINKRQLRLIGDESIN